VQDILSTLELLQLASHEAAPSAAATAEDGEEVLVNTSEDALVKDDPHHPIIHIDRLCPCNAHLSAYADCMHAIEKRIL
jgi:hypothetical protein